MHKFPLVGSVGVEHARERFDTGQLISQGLVTPLDTVPFHANGPAPLSRLVLAGGGVHDGLGRRVVAHEMVEVGVAQRSYCEPHVHDCAELNLLLSTSELVYEIRLGYDLYEFVAPASIYVPAGLLHSANVISGTGFFIAMIDTSDYVAATRRQPISMIVKKAP